MCLTCGQRQQPVARSRPQRQARARRRLQGQPRLEGVRRLLRRGPLRGHRALAERTVGRIGGRCHQQSVVRLDNLNTRLKARGDRDQTNLKGDAQVHRYVLALLDLDYMKRLRRTRSRMLIAEKLTRLGLGTDSELASVGLQPEVQVSLSLLG